MDARDAVAELVELHRAALGDELVAMYLFGSLAAGGFVPGKSDVDMLTVVERALAEDDLPPLEELHASFVERHPEWRDRVEVGYVSRHVLQTVRGSIAVISPGEPLNVKEAGLGWTLNWHGVCTIGETLLGPAPTDVAPSVTPDAFAAAVRNQLEEWRDLVRERTVEFVPAHQGYIVATVARASYALETGEQTSKERAVEWAAERYPDYADFLRSAYAAYRADRLEPHRRTIAFVDRVLDDAARSGPST